MLTMRSCWPLSFWPWCHVDLSHFDHDVMLTFIMLSMVILAFGLTQALLCDIWLVLWIFGEATKVIPHRQNNTSWPKQYLLTLANVRVRTWKQWVTVSEQRTSKSKHLDHHQVLTFREKTSLHRLHNNHCGTFSPPCGKRGFRRVVRPLVWLVAAEILIRFALLLLFHGHELIRLCTLIPR